MSKLPFKVELEDSYVLVPYAYEVCVTYTDNNIEYLYTDTPDRLIKEMSKNNKYKTIPYIKPSNRDVKKRLNYINNLNIKNMQDLVLYLGETCKYIEDGYINANTESEILKGLFVETEEVYLESLIEVATNILKDIRKTNINTPINYKGIPVDPSNNSMANISTILESYTKLGNNDTVEFKGEDGRHLILKTEADIRNLYATVYIHRSSSFGAEYDVISRVRGNEYTIITQLTNALNLGQDTAVELLKKYFMEVYERRKEVMSRKYLDNN